MTGRFAYDPASFKGAEHAGWERVAPDYAGALGRVTAHAAGPLLDATGAGPGTRLLELCCGPGYVAGAAAARGAAAVGIDFAAGMVRAAQALHPGATFRQEDAEALTFDAAVFEAAVCAFGIHHVPEPERLLAEAHRVLVPGGRFAFAMWCGPERNEFFALVLGAIRRYGRPDPPLPPGPPVFRFSDPAACAAALLAAGFESPTVADLPLVLRPASGEDVLAFTYGAAVRMVMLLDAQTESARERIHQAIVDGAAGYVRDGRIEIAMPAVLASATRPRS
jgi:SAM-dependent methyltransferase